MESTATQLDAPPVTVLALAPFAQSLGQAPMPHDDQTESLEITIDLQRDTMVEIPFTEIDDPEEEIETIEQPALS